MPEFEGEIDVVVAALLQVYASPLPLAVTVFGQVAPVTVRERVGVAFTVSIAATLVATMQLFVTTQRQDYTQ